MYIYVTKNLINSKYYVGKSEVKNDNYLGSGKIFRKALIKYGKENFQKTIICYCKNLYELNNLEKLYIKLFKVKYKKDCYNIAEGGTGGNTMKFKSEEEKLEFSLKMSVITSGENNPFYGKTHTDETKVKCGIKNIDKSLSEHHKLILKNINTGNQYNKGRKHSKEVNMKKASFGENNGMFGKQHSVETLDKISKNISKSKEIKYKCEYCSKETDKGNYNRWHSHNCKLNPNITEEQLKKREPYNKIKI